MAGRHRRQRHATAGLRDVLTASTCTPALGGRHHTLGKAAPASARLPWLLRPSGPRTTLISQRSHPSMLHHHGSPPPRTTTSRLIEAKPSCAIARSPFPSRLVCTMRILVSFEVCQVALLPPHPTLNALDPLSEGKGTKFTQLACQLPLSEAYRGLTRQARLLSSFYLVSSPSWVCTQ